MVVIFRVDTQNASTRKQAKHRTRRSEGSGYVVKLQKKERKHWKWVNGPNGR